MKNYNIISAKAKLVNHYDFIKGFDEGSLDFIQLKKLIKQAQH